MKGLPVLLRALREPAAMAAFDERDWDLLLRQAGAAKLGATLGLLAEEHGLLAALPARARRRRCGNATWARCASSCARCSARWQPPACP